MLKPLEGVRVVDISHVIAGPLASFYLAQLGAEVIKIEAPHGGDVMRASKVDRVGDMPDEFVALNAGKRSLAVDFRQPEGAELICSLAGTAGVFIENFRPGVVARYGLDYTQIELIKPDIVYCSISGFGQQGTWSKRGAYDHVVQALTGMMMMQGGDIDAPPLKVGFPVIDVAVGLMSALAIVAAVHQRSRDGKGQYVDSSMVEASLMLMYPHASNFLTNRVEPQRVGNRGYSGSPTADTYRCLDGWLSLAANTPAQFRKLTELLNMQSLCDDAQVLDLAAFNAPGGGFVVAKDLAYLEARFKAAFVERSAVDMEQRLNAVGVPCARVRRLGEFLDEMEHGDGLDLPVRCYVKQGNVVRTPGLGFRYLGDDTALGAPAPALGADTRALLEELGLSGERILALTQAKVIA